MRNKISYEWRIEVLDDNGVDPLDFTKDKDILNIEFFDGYKDMKKYIYSIDTVIDSPWRVALVRNTYNECEGLLKTEFAYSTKSNELPQYFDDCGEQGAKVPQRFHAFYIPTQKIYITRGK